MKSLKNLTGDSLEQLIDYNVVDQNGDEIGTLHSLWSDPDTGAVEFLGVKTGWLFGHNHVVPAEKAELDEEANLVRLPYTEAFIKEAPSISADAEISEAEEDNIYRYYGIDDAAGAQTTGSSYAGSGTLPEAAGAAALASTSGADEGASPYAAPAGDFAGREDAGASRWRRTSRPGDAATGTTSAVVATGTETPRERLLADAASGTVSAGGSVRSALDDLSPSDSSGTREPLTTAAPGSYGTTNLYGSTGMDSPVSADALGAPMDSTTMGGVNMVNPDLKANAATPAQRNTATGMAGAGLHEAGASNLDPITGEPGAHPVGAGAGALSAGAAGAAIGGAVGGPIGAPVGAVIGAIVGGVGGGLAGKGIAEAINPTEEDAHWQANFRHAPYFQNDYEFSDYAPAYKVGYEGYRQSAMSGRRYADMETDMQRDFEQTKGTSRLDWEKAKAATRDAWDRAKAKAANSLK